MKAAPYNGSCLHLWVKAAPCAGLLPPSMGMDSLLPTASLGTQSQQVIETSCLRTRSSCNADGGGQLVSLDLNPAWKEREKGRAVLS